MSKGQTSAVVSVLVSAAIALLAIFGYNVAVVQPALNEVTTEQPAGGTSNFDSLEVASDLVVGGSLSVTGGVTGTNVLTTGNQTIAGIKTFSTPAVMTGLTGPLALTGPTAVATATPAMVVNNLGAGNVSFEVRDSATPVFQVKNGGGIVATGSINSLAAVLAKDASYPVTTADSGAVIKASGAITLTLPGAVAGLQYCIVNYTGDDQVIDFADATDVALNEVNSPGDRVTNTTAYDNICLAAIDATNWVTISSVGTWADGN